MPCSGAGGTLRGNDIFFASTSRTFSKRMNIALCAPEGGKSLEKQSNLSLLLRESAHGKDERVTVEMC